MSSEDIIWIGCPNRCQDTPDDKCLECQAIHERELDGKSYYDIGAEFVEKILRRL